MVLKSALAVFGIGCNEKTVMLMDENKRKALEAALGQIEKQFGKGSIMRMGDQGVARDIDAVSTGSLGLDIALGIGGLPRGRVVEIYGPESSGKPRCAWATKVSRVTLTPFRPVLWAWISP